MKKAKYLKLFSAISGLLVFVAAFGIKPMCLEYMYQPKAPKHLPFYT